MKLFALVFMLLPLFVQAGPFSVTNLERHGINPKAVAPSGFSTGVEVWVDSENFSAVNIVDKDGRVWPIADFGSASYSEKTSYQVLDTDGFRFLNIDSAASTRIVTLPTAADNSGRQITVKRDGVEIVTIDGEGAETIDGAATLALGTDQEAKTVYCTGTEWKVFDEVKRAPPQVLTVSLAGSDFASVKSAVDSISDASATKPYTVQVAPGVYTEAPFTVPSFVTVCGWGGMQQVVLQTSDDANHFITGAQNATLKNLAVEGPTNSGQAAIYYAEEGTDPFFLDHVLIRKGYYGVWANQAAARGVIHAFFLANEYVGASMEQFVRVTGYGNFTGLNVAYMNGAPAAVDTGYYVDGANAEMTLDLAVFRNAGSTDGVFADNGATVRLTAVTFSQGDQAIHVGPSGATELNAAGCVIRDGFTKDIFIQSSSAIVNYSGVANKEAFDIDSSATFSAVFTDDTVDEEGQVVIGELWLGTGGNGSVPLASYTRGTASTGKVSGGLVTTGTAEREIDYTAGTGFVTSDVSVISVSWGAGTTTAPADIDDGHIYTDATGTMVATSSSFFNHSDHIELAGFSTNATEVVILGQHFAKMTRPAENLHLYIRNAIGPIHVSGLAATEATPPSTSINVDAGSFYSYESLVTVGSSAPITFTSWTRDGSGGWDKATGNTTVGTLEWDDGGGSPATLTGGKFRKDFLWVAADNEEQTYHLVVGQTEFDTQGDAEDGGNPNHPAALSINGCPIAGIVIEQGDNEITSIIDERPSISGAGTGGTAASEHGDLAGLADDDHAQYQKENEKGAVNGYAGLDGSSEVLVANLPNTIAQWNADQIQGIDVDDAAIADGKHLAYESGSGDLVYVSPSHVVSAFIEVTADTTTTNTLVSPATLLTLSITPFSASSFFLVDISAAADNTANTDEEISFQLWYGLTSSETQQRATYLFSDAAAHRAGSCALTTRLAALGAGEHTFQVRWGTSGGTAQVQPVTKPDTHHASLRVQETIN